MMMMMIAFLPYICQVQIPSWSIRVPLKSPAINRYLHTFRRQPLGTCSRWVKQWALVWKSRRHMTISRETGTRNLVISVGGPYPICFLYSMDWLDPHNPDPEIFLISRTYEYSYECFIGETEWSWDVSLRNILIHLQLCQLLILGRVVSCTRTHFISWVFLSLQMSSFKTSPLLAL